MNEKKMIHWMGYGIWFSFNFSPRLFDYTDFQWILIKSIVPETVYEQLLKFMRKYQIKDDERVSLYEVVHLKFI